MSIETYGSGERLRIAAGLLLGWELSGHLVLLPVPSTRDGIHVTGCDAEICEVLSSADENTVIVGYSIPRDASPLALSRGARVLDLSTDEKYILENARLTALGCLGYLLGSEKRAISECSVGIVGYGRIGSALTELLCFLGARVKVYTSRESTRNYLCSLGIESALRDELNFDTENSIDILINTAPCDLSAELSAGASSLGFRIIELASGKNLEGVSGVEYLPSLPEKMYPKSAARAYAEAVKRYLKADEEGEGK